MGAITEDGCTMVEPAPDSPYGFTAERFDGWLSLSGDAVYVSFIVSLQPGQGHVSQLFDAIIADGLTVKVPTPIGQMPAILQHKGFTLTHEYDDDFGQMVDVWVLRP